MEVLLQNGNSGNVASEWMALPASVEEIKHAMMSLLELVSIENGTPLYYDPTA